MSIFKACDIRGVAGHDLDEEMARKIGRALGIVVGRAIGDRGFVAGAISDRSFLGGAITDRGFLGGAITDRGFVGDRRVFVAGDFRHSTPALKRALQAGLVEMGAQLVDLGQVPTPVAYFAAARQGCGNVAIVTASHNPGRYNGVKFMVAGQPAVPELIAELQALLDVPHAVPLPRTTCPQTGRHSERSEESGLNGGAAQILRCAQNDDLHSSDRNRDLVCGQAVRDYEAAVSARATELSGCDASALARRGLTIAVDAFGGAFCEIAPRVLRQSGCRVIPLRCAADPDFAHGDPNPAADANLAELARCVVAHRADFGVAFDGDGDRAALVDSHGTIVRPEQFGALLIGRCFSRPLVVFDLKCASLLRAAAQAAGGTSLMQPSGHGFIKTAMILHRADLGVEASGHYFFRALGGGDDGLFVALLAAGLVARSGLSLAELIAPIGWPAITPDLRFPLPDDAGAVLERIAAHCGGEVSRLDGVRAEYHDGWALARLSITEPLITLRFEACRRDGLPEIAARFLRGVPDLCKQVLEALQ